MTSEAPVARIPAAAQIGDAALRSALRRFAAATVSGQREHVERRGDAEHRHLAQILGAMEMHVRVDQPGEERLASPVDDARACRSPAVRGHGHDARALHQHSRVVDRPARRRRRARAPRPATRAGVRPMHPWLPAATTPGAPHDARRARAQTGRQRLLIARPLPRLKSKSMILAHVPVPRVRSTRAAGVHGEAHRPQVVRGRAELPT